MKNSRSSRVTSFTRRPGAGRSAGAPAPVSYRLTYCDILVLVSRGRGWIYLQSIHHVTPRLGVDRRLISFTDVSQRGAESPVRMRTKKCKEKYTSEDEKTQLKSQGTLPQRRGKRTYNKVAHLLGSSSNMEQKHNMLKYRSNARSPFKRRENGRVLTDLNSLELTHRGRRNSLCQSRSVDSLQFLLQNTMGMELGSTHRRRKIRKSTTASLS